MKKGGERAGAREGRVQGDPRIGVVFHRSSNFAKEASPGKLKTVI